MTVKHTLIRSGSALDVEVDLGRLTRKQAQFCMSRTLYTAYGGARGGGKTHAVRVKAIGGAIRYPGIRILIVRRTYPELQQNHIEQIIRLVPVIVGAYNATNRALYFKNGSIIKFGHYAGDVSETEYQGQEYDWIFMDEATQFSERDFRYLGGLLRGVRDIPKRFYLTCNPGGIGHRWVKRLFIDRAFITDRENQEENENPDDYSFIPATVEDNTYLLRSSPAYVRMLSSLPENIRRAHRYGDWNTLSGTYFPEFDASVHVVAPFQIPGHWVRYRAFDYGLDMLACGWFAQDETGRSYLYRELSTPNLIVSDAAKRIVRCTLPEENVAVTFAPPDMWSRQKDSGKTMAELFTAGGVPVVRADSNRIQGWQQVKEALKVREDGKPALLLFSSCRTAIQCLEAMLADEKNPNDCAKEPHDITHMPDAVRYYCVSRTMRAEAAPPLYREAGEDDGLENAYGLFMTGDCAGRGYLEF